MIKFETINLFVSSMLELAESGSSRITIKDGTIRDKTSNVRLYYNNNSSWILHIPASEEFEHSTSSQVSLQDGHNNRIKQTLKNIEDENLIRYHNKFFGNNEDTFAILKKIQEYRDRPMVEEAYQNLLTVYALNMDGESDVS